MCLCAALSVMKFHLLFCAGMGLYGYRQWVGFVFTPPTLFFLGCSAEFFWSGVWVPQAVGGCGLTVDQGLLGWGGVAGTLFSYTADFMTSSATRKSKYNRTAIALIVQTQQPLGRMLICDKIYLVRINDISASTQHSAHQGAQKYHLCHGR